MKKLVRLLVIVPALIVVAQGALAQNPAPPQPVPPILQPYPGPIGPQGPVDPTPVGP
jgi:hypothetical protein